MFISFDCYGTLIHFQMSRTIVEVFGERLPAEKQEEFDFVCEQYRFDEVLGPYQPYRDVIANATRRAAARFGIEYREEDGDALYEAVPTWGPHPGVPEALTALAEEHKLVIISNAADDQIVHNVASLGAPFHEVVTAEQARAYKPRLAAFEHMLARLDCSVEDVIHVSSSPEYDLRPARDLGIAHRILLDRGYEPDQPWLGYTTVDDVANLPAAVERIVATAAAVG